MTYHAITTTTSDFLLSESGRKSRLCRRCCTFFLSSDDYGPSVNTKLGFWTILTHTHTHKPNERKKSDE